MQNVHFTPPQLARLFDVNVSTIKRWVDRDMLKASITSGGHRRVSQKDLADFKKRYPKLTTKSYTLRRLSKIKKPAKDRWLKYYELLYSGNDKEAKKILEEIFVSGEPIISIVENFIIPTLVHIGQEWMNGKILIYEEHRTSFYIREHAQYLESLIPDPPKKAPTALLACVKGEQHEILLILLKIVLKLNKWQGQILGINVPLPDFKKAIIKEKPKMICLTKSYPLVRSDVFLKNLTTEASKSKIQIIYGGNGWSKSLVEKKWPQNKAIYCQSLYEFDKCLKK